MSVKVERACENCGNTFFTFPSEVKRGGGRYCSPECNYKAKQNRIECSCLHCGKEFNVTQSAFNDGRGKYCSQECCDKARSFNRICEYCGKEFKIWRNQTYKRLGKYCSKKCARQAICVRVEKTCQQCGKLFSVKPSEEIKGSGKFCSTQCHGKWKSENLIGENSATWQGGKVGYRGPNWVAQRKKALKRDNYTCQYCRKKEPKGKKHQVHHIIPFREFGYIIGENDNYKQANDLNNLITLCYRCHRKAEFGLIAIQPKLL